MRHVITAILIGSLFACASTGSESQEPRGSRTSAAPEDLGSVATHETWLAVDDMQGLPHDLRASLAEGREVALVFWQTWCASCIEEAPHVVEAASRRAGTTDFVGVISGPDGTVDDAEVRRMTSELALTYPQVRDRDAAIARRFDVKGTPTIVVIAPDGRIVFRGHELPAGW